MVVVQHLARVLRVEPLVGALRPRHGRQPVEVRPDHRRLAGGVAHRLEAAKLAFGLGADGVGHAGLVDLRAVLLDDRALVLAELLADRVHLPAQEPLALLLLRARLDVVADALPHLKLGEPLALQRQRVLEPLDHVDLLEQLDPLREGDVGGVGARVGERARVGDRAQELVDAVVRLADLEDLLDDGAVLALELARLHGRRVLVGTLLDLDAQPALGVGVRGADHGPVQARQRDGVAAAGKADALHDLGDGADLRVLLLVPWHQEDAGLVAGVDRQGHGHAREHDGVLERNEQDVAHDLISIPCTRYPDCTSSTGA